MLFVALTAALATSAPEVQPATSRLSFLEQNYFAAGFDFENQVKFRLSVKVDLVPSLAPWTVHFAYSQVSLWNLFSAGQSAPFVESNYAPELFLTRWFVPEIGARMDGLRLEYLRLGFEHRSNGQDRGSRSLNRPYVEARVSHSGLLARAECPLPDVDQRTRRCPGAFVGSRLTLFAPIASAENPDLVDYLGVFEWSVFGGWSRPQSFGQAQLELYLRKGMSSELDRGAVRVMLTVEPSFIFPGLPQLVDLYAEYFGGYGEVLGFYDQPRQAFRAGLAFGGLP